MIVIDENFPDSVRRLLQGWRISFRQVAFEIGREGLKDDEIIPLLHSLNKPTFFTLDEDFFTPKLCHAQYCVIYLDVHQYEAAAFMRTSHHDYLSPNTSTFRKKALESPEQMCLNGSCN